MKGYEFKWPRFIIVSVSAGVLMFGVTRGVRELTGIDSFWVAVTVAFLLGMILPRFLFIKKSAGNKGSPGASSS